MKPYFTDEQATLYLGDALTALQSLPDASINCCVTSPPYFGLRDYGVDGQIGAEKSPAEYLNSLVAIMAEVRRVLAKDGTAWLNIGDSYARQGGARRGAGSALQGRKHGAAQEASNLRRRKPGVTLPEKNLMLIPQRLIIALQEDGWIVRQQVIWAKPNGMPESVADRLTSKHEHLFLLTKSRRYWFDLDPIREPLMYPDAADGTNKADKLQTGSSARRTGGAYGKPRSVDEGWNAGTGLAPHTGYRGTHEQGRNPGDVWTIPTQPFTGAHFAVFPVEIPRRAIAAGCKPGGVVLDPFSGSGTTGLAAAELGRRYVGIDLNRDYLELSLRTRLSQPSLTAEVGS